MEKVIETKVANASEKALQKLIIPTAQIFSEEIGSKRKLEFPENFTLTPKKILTVFQKKEKEEKLEEESS